MDAVKRGRGRPRGGRYGALRVKLAAMLPGQSITVPMADLTENGQKDPGSKVSQVGRLAAQDLDCGASFTVLTLTDGVYVRRMT